MSAGNSRSSTPKKGSYLPQAWMEDSSSSLPIVSTTNDGKRKSAPAGRTGEAANFIQFLSKPSRKSTGATVVRNDDIDSLLSDDGRMDFADVVLDAESDAALNRLSAQSSNRSGSTGSADGLWTSSSRAIMWFRFAAAAMTIGALLTLCAAAMGNRAEHWAMVSAMKIGIYEVCMLIGDEDVCSGFGDLGPKPKLSGILISCGTILAVVCAPCAIFLSLKFRRLLRSAYGTVSSHNFDVHVGLKDLHVRNGTSMPFRTLYLFAQFASLAAASLLGFAMIIFSSISFGDEVSENVVLFVDIRISNFQAAYWIGFVGFGIIAIASFMLFFARNNLMAYYRKHEQFVRSHGGEGESGPAVYV